MKPERARLTDRLDEINLKIIRLMYNDHCAKCGKYTEGKNSHPSHVVPKGNGASWRRFDLNKIFLCCMHDHINWWHKDPLEAGKWFRDKWPTRSEDLDKYRGGKSSKISTQEMKDLLVERKEQLKLLLKEKN